MSITKDHGTLIVECDNCHETFDPETSEFEVAITRMKEEGWIIRKHRGEWKHFDVTKCKEDYAHEHKLAWT